MRGASAACLFSLALFASSAGAFTPESGFYDLFTADADGGEGTGLALEIQNDDLFAAGFVFRPDGSPTFVTIEGQLLKGADGWTLSGENALRGHVDLCPAGASTVERCVAQKGIPFVAYKSASVGLVRDGIGTN